MHSFDTFVICQFRQKYHFLLNCSIFKFYTNIHLKKFVDNIYHLFQKQMLQLLLTYGTLIIHLKANFHLNRISFSRNFYHYLLFQLHFQSHLKVLCTFLILLCLHMYNQKLSIHLHFFSNVSIYFTNNKIQRIYTISALIITNTFHCNISDVINMLLYEFLSIFDKFE